MTFHMERTSRKKLVFTDKDQIRTISSRSPRREEEVMSLGGHTRCNERQEGHNCDRHITLLSSVKCARDVARKEDNYRCLTVVALKYRETICEWQTSRKDGEASKVFKN